MAQHSGNTPENHLRKKPGRKVVTDLAILAENDLIKSGGMLPTPTASDTKGASQRTGRTRGGRVRPDSDERLAGAIERFLPTPRTTDANGAGKHGQGGMDLRTAISELTGAPMGLLFDVGND